MEIGTLIEWIERAFGLAFLLFMLLVLIIPSWHAPQRQRHAAPPRFERGNRQDGTRHDAA